MDNVITIEAMTGAATSDVHELIVELAGEEQEFFDHPQQTREQIQRDTTIPTTFVGENHLFVARDAAGAAVGVCWCVLFEPGTGLEGEVAELYVRPESRGQGIAKRLVLKAMELFRIRNVTLVSAWTRGDNAAALAVYRAAGFAPTEQTVMTWLPLPGR